MEMEMEDFSPKDKDVLNDRKSESKISVPEQKLISLVVKIIVNATIKECYEESNKISEV